MTLRAREKERIIKQSQARQEGWARWSKPSGFIVFLLTLIGIISGVWFLIQESSEPVPTSQLSLIRAEEEPYKVKLEDQEVLSVRHQDKLVYSRIHQGEELPQVEHLLPEPEAPIALSEDVSDIEVLIEGVSMTDDDPIASLISQESTASSGTYKVRLATLDSAEQAQQEWKRLSHKHKDLLSGKSMHIQQVDLGARGTKFTLDVGPFDTDQQADVVAKSLKGMKLRGANAPS